MASVAIGIDNDEPLPRIDNEKPRSCIDRWAEKGLKFLTILGGNGRPSSKVGKCWVTLARVVAFMCGPADAGGKILNELMPCTTQDGVEYCPTDGEDSINYNGGQGSGFDISTIPLRHFALR